MTARPQAVRVGAPSGFSARYGAGSGGEDAGTTQTFWATCRRGDSRFPAPATAEAAGRGPVVTCIPGDCPSGYSFSQSAGLRGRHPGSPIESLLPSSVKASHRSARIQGPGGHGPHLLTQGGVKFIANGHRRTSRPTRSARALQRPLPAILVTVSQIPRARKCARLSNR